MTIERVATNAQSQFMLAQIAQANLNLNQTQQQVATGKVASDYAGMGDKAAMLEAARSAAARADAYQSATQMAVNQADLQNTQLSTLSDLAGQLRQAVTAALANNDASTLMTQAKSIFDQASQILNSKDANGNYLYGGEKDNTPPVSVGSLSDLAALPSASAVFDNGSVPRSVNVGDGQTVQVGLLASDVGGDLMSALKDIANFNDGPTGNFGKTLTGAQSDFLGGAIQTATSAAQNLNNVAAANGYMYNRLQDASTQQQATSTLYKGFTSDLEDVDMASAVSKLNQNQVALQAALQVTSRLNQVSLLNYLPAPTA
ncbi:MAG TPA: flagellin [Rhizomicrobium sp.]|nr:flagellin [Rhizomicrobium sp.]